MKKIIALVCIFGGLVPLIFGQSEPPYGMSQLEAYAVFSDAVRAGDMDLALTFGEWMLVTKPRQIQGHAGFNLERQFDRFITIHTTLAEKAADPVEKSRQYNKALEIFALAEATFDVNEIDEFRWTYRKGRFYHEHQEHIDNGMANAIENYEKAYQMSRQQFVELSDGFYARFLLGHYVSGGERDKALSMIDEIEPYAGSTLSNAINEARNKLFSDPVERIAFLESGLDQSGNGEATLEELLSLYERTGDRQNTNETALRLYQANPGFQNTRRLANIAASDADYHTALRYLKEAFDKSPNNNIKKRIALEISDTYQNLDNLQSARDHTRSAIEIDRSFGEAYMQMATIYAAAISQCTSGRRIDRDDKTVYWLVLDYLDKAAEADLSVRGAANRRIASYERVMPTTEDKFFRGWNEGDRFVINEGCYAWINETTTVR